MSEDNAVVGVTVPASAVPIIDRIAKSERITRSAVLRRVILDHLDTLKGAKPA